MWNYQCVIYILIVNCCSYVILEPKEISFTNDNTNSTNENNQVLPKDVSPVWTNKQFIICFISVSLGTLLFFVTFVIPAIIIIRRASRDKNRIDLRELRRMSDFM